MNDEKGIFLELYDNIEQTYITFKLLEPLDTLAKRAARSAASGFNLEIRATPNGKKTSSHSGGCHKNVLMRASE